MMVLCNEDGPALHGSTFCLACNISSRISISVDRLYIKERGKRKKNYLVPLTWNTVLARCPGHALSVFFVITIHIYSLFSIFFISFPAFFFFASCNRFLLFTSSSRARAFFLFQVRRAWTIFNSLESLTVDSFRLTDGFFSSSFLICPAPLLFDRCVCVSVYTAVYIDV